MIKSKNIIIHFPWKIETSLRSATSLRPLKMIESFKNLGYNLFIIDGDSAERTELYKKLKKQIERGKEFNFVYFETSTWPMAIGEGFSNLFKHPLINYKLLNYYRKKKIPTAVFIRDIYWAFPELLSGLSALKKKVFVILNKFDMKFFSKRTNILYLPSIKMYSYMETYFGNKISVKPLPPGLDLNICSGNNQTSDKINLLYIGGIGLHYRLEKLFKAVNFQQRCVLTVCCRREEWEKEKNSYSLSNNINIVHKSGEELKELLNQCDIGLILVEPGEYWSFAMPVKLFEYLGNGVPIVASRLTGASDFIEQNNIGWSIEYSEKAISNFLKEIDKEDIKVKKDNAIRIAQKNTWEERVKKVVNDFDGI